ncbi:serrate RNA effector molecule homolog [Sinocyclocheilus grahami]|uniref:serrate RNA effector molecule homolog n=1 Tax=Sinocyclocheilus grahami TaxID=75366 RepID=UPI0007AD0290|nr:PREDICTED: serrate RNA effector molecule homolog [Sinocyclocheilus grahami]
MADSDDEYDRRRRDKFRRERSDYDRSREREDRRRDDWNDRDDHGGDPYHGGYDLGYGGGGGPGYAPPQPWGHPDMHLMQPHHGIPIQARLGNIHDMDLGPPLPVMKTFKEFLLSLDDSVDETESVKRYNEYKIDFRRQQMQDFFLAHKDEEWFRTKYHPDEAGRRKAEAHSALQNRLNVYMYLMDNNSFESISLDIEHAPQITKILDAAVIKMEGGTENDLRILEQPNEEEEERERLSSGGPGSEPPKRDEPRPADVERKPSTEKDKMGEGDEGTEKDAAASAGGSEGEEKTEKEAPAEPIPEPKKVSYKVSPFFRRCWVTFDRGVNIKEICWNLQNIRLRDCELAPGVNRDLARRVRNVNGITQHKQVLRNDIKLAAKLIHSLDDKERLWSHKLREETHALELPAQNPILKNITDYLIEEVSAEEEELLGSAGGADSDEASKEGNPTEITVERDEKLVKVLDRLLFYLRIVHSIDYYNTCEYPSEDEMPNRCGIIHVRGPIPPNRITHREVADWQKTFEEKLGSLFSVKETLSEDEAAKMGRKDPEQELEKFVLANTQELGKDKWLCPLSGKKFKGPEFVRKHILNKHGDKIEEVKKEVVFFNNFLMDAKRPSIPEMKPPPPPGPGQGVLSPGGLPFPPQGPQGLMGFGQPRPPVMGYGGGPPYPPNQYGGGGRGNYDNFRGQGGYPGKPRNNRMMRGDPRNIIEYRDLDAPDDVDFF